MKNGEKQKARYSILTYSPTPPLTILNHHLTSHSIHSENLSAALVLLRQSLAKHNAANPSSPLPTCPMQALEEAIELASPLVRLVTERRGAKV
jgi:hypothetical protein